MSVFISAIKNENMEVFSRMCNFGLTEKHTHSLMVCAIVNESISVIKYFIAKNIDLNFHMLAEFSETCSAKMMKSSLNFGIESKNLEIVKLLVENGARSSVQEITIRYDSCYYNSLSPILICCISKDWNIFEYLLDNSNIVHFYELFDRLGVNGKVDLLKKLVKKHINKIKDVNPYVDEREIVQSNTLIPLFGSSLYFNKMEIYYYLLENFNIDLEVRYKIIRDLCILNKYDILDQFLTKYPGEITYFPYACEHDSEEIIACLIKHDAYIHPLRESNPTLLTKIAERNFIGVAQLLLDKGIKINHQSNRGWTALMSAVTNGHVEMVQFLIDNGADQSLKNEHGRNVLEMAKYKNRVKIIKILES
jgi:ankyrin repeat protein